MSFITFPEILPKTLAVKLTAVGERSIRNYHPWLFSGSIQKITKEGSPGDIAIIFSHKKNKVIGVGLYDPLSPIRIKMLHFDTGIKLNALFFKEKIEKAYRLRQKALQHQNTNSYRLIFGENDGFPGLIVDIYDTTVVVKLYSKIWIPYLNTIIKLIIEITHCSNIVLRLSRLLQNSAVAPLKDGVVIYGNLESEKVSFIEHGVHFSANVIKGHKTGYFLDHRENRRKVGLLSKGMKVLDVFSYAGGFSVHALVNGAKEVTSLDSSEHALQIAIENGKRNSFKGLHSTITGDAFAEMRRLIAHGKKYNIVVIDPPSFAKSSKEIKLAKKKYAELAQLGILLTAKKGMLVLASCSSRIQATDFFAINLEVLQAAKRTFVLEDRTTHDFDHPIGFSEGAYLKCGYYRLD